MVALTPKKAKWSKNRRVNLLGNQLAYNASTEAKYARKIRELVATMTTTYKKEIKKLFKTVPAADTASTAMDANLGSQARILLNSLRNKFFKLFSSKAKDLADNMFNNINRNSKTDLKSSLKQLTGGLSLNTGVVSKGFEEIAAATIAENVSYIESIPEQYHTQVSGAVLRSITTGRGVADLIPEIEKYDGMTYRRAKNIALDQTRKAYSTMNAERLKVLNVPTFEWLHSGGGADPRDSHVMMDGKIFTFANLIEEQKALGVPEQDRGLPAIPPGCKCTIRPIIDLSMEDNL